MPHVPNPDPALLKALADAGWLPKEEAAQTQPKPRQRSRRGPRKPRIRVEEQPADEFWPFVLMLVLVGVLACFMAG